MRQIFAGWFLGSLFLMSPLLVAQNKTAIAVLNFEAKNVNQETADAVADILSTELFNTNRFKVIERQAIAQLLEEQKLQMTGVTDMSKAAEIGKILNVEKIMTGSVSKLGRNFIINTRLVDVETGELELAQNAKSEKGEDGLPAAIADLVKIISQKIVIEGSVIKIAPELILIDLGKEHGLRTGQTLDVVRIGDVITDLGGATIGRTEDRIGEVRVLSVKGEYSETEIVQKKTSFRLGDKVRLTSSPIEGNVENLAKKRKKDDSKPKQSTKKKTVELPPVF